MQSNNFSSNPTGKLNVPNSTVSPIVQRRIIATLFAAQSIFSAALLQTFTVTAIVATKLTGLESLAGIPGTLNLAGRAFIGYPIAWLMERYGRRVSFVLGYLLGGLGAVISAYAIWLGSFLLFCLGALLLGMGRGISEQTRYAAAEVYVPAERGKVIGWIVSASTIGSIVGPLLIVPSTRWSEHFLANTFIGPFLLAGLMAGVTALLVFVYLRPDPLTIGQQLSASELSPSQQLQQANAPVRPMAEIFANGTLRLALAAMVIGQFVMTLIMSITALHMEHNGHGMQDISWVLMAHTLGMFGLAIVTGWLIQRVGQVNMILVGGSVLVLSAIVAPLSPDFMPLAASLFLLGLGWNFCFIAGSSLLSNSLAAHERVRAQGFGETFVSIASGVASLGSFVLFAYGGILLVCAMGLACALLFMASAVWSTQRNPVIEASEPQA